MVIFFGNSKYKDVLAISSIHNATNSLLYLYGGAIWADSTDSRWLWVCAEYNSLYGVCNIAEAASHPQNLTVNGNSIDYCLAQEVEGKCMLQFNLSIMLVVIICNLIKLICMIQKTKNLNGMRVEEKQRIKAVRTMHNLRPYRA